MVVILLSRSKRIGGYSSDSMSNKSALVIGGTGAVGKALLRDLLVNSKYKKITTVGRRDVILEENVPTDRLIQINVDFEDLERHREAFRGYDVVFCTLGTTRADAGGAAGFRKVDHDYVINSAKIIAEENKPISVGGLSPIHYLYCSVIVSIICCFVYLTVFSLIPYPVNAY